MTVKPDLLFFFFLLVSLQIISGLSGDPSTSKHTPNVVKVSSSKKKNGINVLVICLGLLAVVGFSVFLFKIWQKKKREEQHARLLRLFEEDDELELELGLRD
ncbi:hypothetical protein H6P81_001433 [Aristolochia fimbriata]|uniref:Transmembrane protein n=1 Tax=Aristolochia fimbriata TaxID=158543 RepID=A0AAV7F9K0_ARIFI|nr:hypothetical protein H6P81_001433 [Aristolochia fimbriata]